MSRRRKPAFKGTPPDTAALLARNQWNGPLVNIGGADRKTCPECGSVSPSHVPSCDLQRLILQPPEGDVKFTRRTSVDPALRGCYTCKFSPGPLCSYLADNRASLERRGGSHLRLTPAGLPVSGQSQALTHHMSFSVLAEACSRWEELTEDDLQPDPGP